MPSNQWLLTAQEIRVAKRGINTAAWGARDEAVARAQLRKVLATIDRLEDEGIGEESSHIIVLPLSAITQLQKEAGLE